MRTRAALAVIVAVILQPELRRALDRLGAPTDRLLSSSEGERIPHLRDRSSCRALGAAPRGADSSRARGGPADTWRRASRSIPVNTSCYTIFYPNTPCTRRVIVGGTRFVAAACVLPWRGDRVGYAPRHASPAGVGITGRRCISIYRVERRASSRWRATAARAGTWTSGAW